MKSAVLSEHIDQLWGIDDESLLLYLPKVSASRRGCKEYGLHIYNNKKVLLRERKRHTARRVASPLGGTPPYPGDTYLGQGYPPWLGGTYLGQGVPTLVWDTNLRWDGVLPPRCGQTNKLKLLPSPILRMRAVKI